jgi:NAD(P)-dependent dehydrogenase (short-subunit alcohol dehydrogenase family)
MRGRDLAILLGTIGAGAWLALRAYREGKFNFAGKNVLITGGSRGLGIVLSRQLAQAGARLAICARDEDELHRAKQDLEEYGRPVVALPCDITQQQQVEATVKKVQDELGPIDVLINNAGIITTGPLECMTIDDFQEAMNTNFWGALYAILAVLPQMRERQEGRIVNISSIGGKVSVPHLLPYSAAKFALTGLSEGLRSELAKDNIVVTTVCPGLMRTGSPRNAMFKGQHRAEYAWFSISDALPVTSVSAEHAARSIISACRRGDAELVISLPARFAVLFHGIFPGLTASLLQLVNRLLPGPDGAGTETVPGRESESAWSPSALTALSDRAAERNNEIPAPSTATR